MTEDWLSRWREGRIGWHEVDGNSALRTHWPDLEKRSRILVPLCGKSPDLLWLAGQGYCVTGVELSEIAIRDFFEESAIHFECQVVDDQPRFHSRDPDITLVCGDYFQFSDRPFDAIYDRGSLVALPPGLRSKYVEHTNSLLAPNAFKLLVTLEYDQDVVAGPPYAVLSDEVLGYWNDLTRVTDRNDIDNSPPKFRKAGLNELIEAVWMTP